jgi:hypothetical protein
MTHFALLTEAWIITPPAKSVGVRQRLQLADLWDKPTFL